LLDQEYLLTDRHSNCLVINISNNTPSNNNNSSGFNSNEFVRSSFDDLSPPMSPNQDYNLNIQTKNFAQSNNSNVNLNSNASGSINSNLFGNIKLQQTKAPCTIYKLNLDFLVQSSVKNSEKFNQLIENSTRTIKRDLSNFSSQFLFTNDEEKNRQYSIYQRIIASNVTKLS
jgi:hypothetical protein